MSSAMNDRQAAMLRAVVGNARPANAWEQRQYALEDQRREVRKQVQLQGARFALLKAQLRALGATRL
jgi:hypothetical protein